MLRLMLAFLAGAVSLFLFLRWVAQPDEEERRHATL